MPFQCTAATVAAVVAAAAAAAAVALKVFVCAKAFVSFSFNLDLFVYFWVCNRRPL